MLLRYDSNALFGGRAFGLYELGRSVILLQGLDLNFVNSSDFHLHLPLNRVGN
jgi:hypothetical protein